MQKIDSSIPIRGNWQRQQRQFWCSLFSVKIQFIRHNTNGCPRIYQLCSCFMIRVFSKHLRTHTFRSEHMH